MEQNLIIVKQLPVIEEKLKKVSEAVEQKINKTLSLVCDEETVKTIKKTLNPANIRCFREKNEKLLNTICEYASVNPFEAVACDLSKRFIENVNKNKLTIEQNFISKSPYRKHHFFLLPFTDTETNPLSDLLRKCWNGKF